LEVKGTIYRVAGPVVTVIDVPTKMYDVVKIGNEGLMGEVIGIEGDKSTIQVYEDTSAIAPGEPVENTGMSLSVELGPGLLTSVYDGIQRPLPVLLEKMGDFIERGVTAPGLDREKKWEFAPIVTKGTEVKGGDVIGTVQEAHIEHRIMVPPNVSGTVDEIKKGVFTVTDCVCTLVDGTELTMMQKWPVRTPRPVRRKLMPDVPLITGQRILDGLFPVAKGGTAAIPGPFGSGKCVTGKTPVICATGEHVSIAELFSNAQGRREVSGYEEIVELDTPLELIGFDGGAIKSVHATQVFKGMTSRLIRIKTRSGRELEVTPTHALFQALDCEITETPAGDLAEGDYLAMPRKLAAGNSNQSINYSTLPLRVADSDINRRIKEKVESFGTPKKEVAPKLGVSYGTLINYCERNAPPLDFVEKLKLNYDTLKAERDSKPITLPRVMDVRLAEFLGLLLSDGMIKGEKVVCFFNNDDRIRERFSTLAKELFNLETSESVENTVKTSSVASVALVTVLSHVFGMPTRTKSRNCHVPEQVTSGDDMVVSAFLEGYFNGDGSVTKDIEFSTASRAMASGISHLLTRLGILYRASLNGSRSRVFITSGSEMKLFYERLSDKRAAKALRLGELVSGDHNHWTSKDPVPMTKEFLKSVYDDLSYAKLKGEGLEIHNYLAGEVMSRKMFATLAKESDNPAVASFDSTLKHVFCDRITEIDVIDEDMPVYDVVVPETRNFIGGGVPALYHNTVTQQQLAKWSDTEIVVYIGCGERGNEMADVLNEFPELEDPKTGKPLMERTVLIANTSNMPVAAREASVYTGITIAEYFRDMGYDVSLMADSTSRWAEAMREISSRLEEMPGEEGYPAYLAARLSEFYERAGSVETLSGTNGSVTVIGAVSPPGGDFSEPVTQNTLRIVKVFWALDSKLSQRRHFPSINWLESYSLYTDALAEWYEENVSPEWPRLRSEAMEILQKESELQEIVQLVGSDALPEDQQLTLEVARMIREYFLQQNAFHDVDTFCEMKKQYKLMKAIMKYSDLAITALEGGADLEAITSMKSKDDLSKVKFEKEFDAELNKVLSAMDKEFEEIRG